MSYRSFIFRALIVVITFVVINAVLWFGWVKDIVAPQENGGDLVRMGYISGFRAPRQEICDLAKQHIDISQYNKGPVDMVTVGDSFSVGGGFGKNRYYQDYIASNDNLTVLNVPSYHKSGSELQFQPLVTLVKLINSGYLDIMKPRYVLLESIERQVLERFVSHFDLSGPATVSEIDNYFLSNKFVLNQSDTHGIKFINNGNWKFLRNSLYYKFNEHIPFSKVIKARLTRSLFRSNNPEKLLFYEDDLSAAVQSVPKNIEKLNKNLNLLADLLEKKGIKLVFMPVVDKYDLYRPYFVSSRYPQNHFFDLLRLLPKKYILIDTKGILEEKLSKGEMDLFYSDDTHWTWNASEAVFESVHF